MAIRRRIALLALVALVAWPLPVYAQEPGPGRVRFAVIGDFGDGSQASADVAALVAGWQPDFVVTTGDNNYPDGAAETMDEHVGRLYGPFIDPDPARNRFFPTLGNHDWQTTAGDPPLPYPYLEYFTLPNGPGRERYYEVLWGPVHIFAVDSDWREPDGNGAASRQAAWLQERLAASSAPWKLVFMHEPPYSSGWHGSSRQMRWPFADWGASAVLAGHDHSYERLQVDGIPYFVNGLGGGSRYWFVVAIPGSQVRFNGDAGAMLVEADPQRIHFQMVTRRGEIVDSFAIARDAARTGGLVPAPVAPRSLRHDPWLRPTKWRVVGWQ